MGEIFRLSSADEILRLAWQLVATSTTSTRKSLIPDACDREKNDEQALSSKKLCPRDKQGCGKRKPIQQFKKHVQSTNKIKDMQTCQDCRAKKGGNKLKNKLKPKSQLDNAFVQAPSQARSPLRRLNVTRQTSPQTLLTFAVVDGDDFARHEEVEPVVRKLANEARQMLIRTQLITSFTTIDDLLDYLQDNLGRIFLYKQPSNARSSNDVQRDQAVDRARDSYYAQKMIDHHDEVLIANLRNVLHRQKQGILHCVIFVLID